MKNSNQLTMLGADSIVDQNSLFYNIETRPAHTGETMNTVRNINEIKRSVERIGAKNLAETIKLTEPLNAAFLQGYALEDLQTFKRILVARAVAVISRVCALKATGDFARKQFERQMWRGEEFERGERVFNYSCDPALAKDNMFTPGAWFQTVLDELSVLENIRQANSENFETNEKQRLIRGLVGEQLAVGYAQAAA